MRRENAEQPPIDAMRAEVGHQLGELGPMGPLPPWLRVIVLARVFPEWALEVVAQGIEEVLFGDFAIATVPRTQLIDTQRIGQAHVERKMHL